MQAVLEVVVPVFALIALGYGAAKRQIISKEGFAGMTLFVFTLAAPALLFSGGTRPHDGATGAAAALLSGSLLLFALAVVAARRIFGMGLADAGVFALTAVYGNSVMMGVPIIIAAYGQAGVPPMLGILALQTVVLLGLATVLAEIGLHAQAPWRRVLVSTAAGIVKNPVVLAVLLAVLWSTFGLPVPTVVRRVLDLLGSAGPPGALFCLGGGLAGISATAAWRQTAAIAVLKLFALPAVVWALAWALGLGALDTAVAVTMAALPTGATAFILAARYSSGADRSGAAVVVTTAASILVLSALVAHFQGVVP